MPNTEDQKYEHHKAQRSACSQRVLDSVSAKRLVMAGPGTGKSYLFQQVSEDSIKNGKSKIIVLSFINELVKDLKVDMHGLADVSTLHSFAAKQLKNTQTIYLDLLKVIDKDHLALMGSAIEYAKILYNLESEKDDAIDLLEKRMAYYQSFDPTAIVYELIKLYSKDATKIPQYDLILVDEYQDFNILEAKLIELLATKSCVLIAGDDDQSLYSFKDSRPEKIRELHRSTDYEKFSLPYCSRSTEVVVDAFHDVIRNAKTNGFLTTRIEKDYLYYPNPEKDALSRAFPTIDVKRNIQVVQNAFFIDQAIQNVFEFEPRFDVLIICPLKKQTKALAKALRKKGYRNLSGDESANDHSGFLEKGLSLLLEDNNSCLGWRLCAEALMEPDALCVAINASESCTDSFEHHIPKDIATLIRKLRAIAVKLKNNRVLNDRERELIFLHLGIDPDRLGEDTARDVILSGSVSNKVHHMVKIKITTILGSKGLSYDYVFLANFDDRYLVPTNGIDDESINKFLVALTRSRKRIFIYTSNRTEPQFVSWIDSSRKTLS